MIKVLKNPKTDKFYELKNLILSPNFPWYYQYSTGEEEEVEGHMHMEGYGHAFFVRPETHKFTKIDSSYSTACRDVLVEIIDNNNLFDNYFFLRAAANCIHSNQGIQLSIPHVDHNFPHYNLIVYLTDTGGETFVENEVHDPKEDDVILFTGQHYLKRPIKDRRILLVATIFTYN